MDVVPWRRTLALALQFAAMLEALTAGAFLLERSDRGIAGNV